MSVNWNIEFPVLVCVQFQIRTFIHNIISYRQVVVAEVPFKVLRREIKKFIKKKRGSRFSCTKVYNIMYSSLELKLAQMQRTQGW